MTAVAHPTCERIARNRHRIDPSRKVYSLQVAVDAAMLLADNTEWKACPSSSPIRAIWDLEMATNRRALVPHSDPVVLAVVVPLFGDERRCWSWMSFVAPRWTRCSAEEATMDPTARGALAVLGSPAKPQDPSFDFPSFSGERLLHC